MLRSSNSGFHTISFWFDSALSPSYERKLGSEGYEQVIKLLKRIVRRLRLFFCGLFTRPTAPRRAPWASLIPSVPTNPDPISVDQETLVFRRGGFSPPLSLLIPTFAFPYAPGSITITIQCIWNAPLPILLIYITIPRLRYLTYTRLLSMPGPSTSELLRTL